MSSGFDVRAVIRDYGAAFLILGLVVAFRLFIESPYLLRLATVVFIFSIVVLGLNLLMGYAGQVSLGHAGFFGLGAYSVAIGPTSFGIPSLVSLLLGVGGTALLAYVIGRPILKLKGYYLAMATLAFGAIVSIVLNNESGLTGGPDGMPVARLKLGAITVSGTSMWYWIAGITLVIAALVVCNLLASPTGRALRAIHDSEAAADALGVDIRGYKVLAFVVSAVFASLAGAYTALYDGHITPVTSSILRSVEFLTMAVIGGLGSILGSAVGAAFLLLLPQALTSFHEYEHAILGGMIILAMIFLRMGIVPSVVSWFERAKK